MNTLRRVGRIVFGLFVFSFGSYLTIQANVGLAPWEAFQLGISNVFGIQYGIVVALVGAAILIITVLMKEKIGVGTVLNVAIIGAFVDLFNAIGVVPRMERILPGIGVLLAGLLFESIGTYYSIEGAMGCGPRDSLMVALHKRSRRLPIGAIRGLIEGTVLLAGALMGSKIGVGTVVSVFGIGFMLQAVFRVFRFDTKTVEHESLLDTWRTVSAALQRQAHKS